MEDTPTDLPVHTRPNLSRLEAHRSEIAHARKLRWPVRVIAAWLLERHGLKIDQRNIARFCKRRGIVKGKGETAHPHSEEIESSRLDRRKRRPRTFDEAEKTVFTFDKTKPVETWKSKAGVKPS